MTRFLTEILRKKVLRVVTTTIILSPRTIVVVVEILFKAHALTILPNVGVLLAQTRYQVQLSAL